MLLFESNTRNVPMERWAIFTFYGVTNELSRWDKLNTPVNAEKPKESGPERRFLILHRSTKAVGLKY